MDSDQLKFLRRRLREAVLKQPELQQLKRILLRLGGAFLVPPLHVDADAPNLISNGFLMSGPVKQRNLKASMCHRNVASLWQARRFGIVGIGTGYALSDDGLRRQHSWGVLRDRLLETTERRAKYFGILLQGTAAEQFVAENA